MACEIQTRRENKSEFDIIASSKVNEELFLTLLNRNYEAAYPKGRPL